MIFVKNITCMYYPVLSGGSRSYIGADDTRISAIGSANLLLTFAEERFVHNFQIIDGLLANILIGVDFMSRYNCVTNLSQKIFSLGNAQIAVPLLVRGDTLGGEKLREQGLVPLQSHTQRGMGIGSSKINKQPMSLVQSPERIGLVSIAQETALI